MASLAAPANGGDYDCVIEPSQMLEIRSPVSGLIERVHAERGGSVKRGAPLVTLVSGVERAAVDLSRFKTQMAGQLQSAASRLEQADHKLRRRNDLAEQHYVSMQDRDDAASERAVAQADATAAGENRQLARLELAYVAAQLAQRQLQSPIDGVVVDQALHPGELAEIGENKPYILKLAQINPLRVKVILPVTMYARVKTGLRVEIVPEKPLDERQWAVVSEVDKVLDAASGTFQVRMDLPNPTGALPGGLRCRAKLPGPSVSPA
ncbi:MAG: efflux RND transporter periplasmic adaptor subunit [Burkholderiales bacterium]